MIFVTVGSQLPFDRLVKAVDEWAALHHPTTPVFAQIGMSHYQPQAFEFCQSLSPAEYQVCLEKADLIISHAGIGTIISALESGKPLLLMPRLDNGIECRNDHQFSTIKHFGHLSNITVANNEHELAEILKSLPQKIPVHQRIATSASPALINAIKQFINA